MDGRARYVKHTTTLIVLCLAAAMPIPSATTVALAQEDAAETTREASQDELKRLQGILVRPESTLAIRQDAAALLLLKRTPEATAILVAALGNTDIPDVTLAVLKVIADQTEPDGAFLPALFSLAAAEEPDPKMAECLPPALAAYRGKGVIDRLLKRVGESANVSEKTILIAALGLTGEKRVVTPLIDLLKSEESAIRSAAAKALTDITFIEGLGESHEKWSRWWKEHGPEPREKWLALQLDALKTQVRTLNAQLKQQGDALAALTARLVDVHQANLAAMPSKQRQAAVLVLLDDAVPQLRFLAAGEARKLLAEAKDAVPDLVDKLLSRVADDAPGVRAQIAGALAVSKDKRAADVLLKRIEQEADASALAAVVDALGELREPRSVPGLIKVLTGDQESLIVHAAGALAQIGERNAPTAAAVGPAITPLCELLAGNGRKSENARVREAAVRALARIGRKEALDALIKAIDDPTPLVRFYAAQGLGSVSENKARTIEALLKHLSDEDNGVRAAVANTLGKVGDGRVSRAVAAQLGPTSKETDAEVRSALWRALVSIQKRETDPKVTEELADEFAGYGGQANLDGAAQLYEIAAARFGAASGNGRLDQLRLKLAETYMQAGQATKAAEILEALLRNAKTDDRRAMIQRRLGDAMLQIPPYVKGAEILAGQARQADPALRDELLKKIFSRAQRLQADRKVAEAYAVLSKARSIVTATWAGSGEADRMETLAVTVARAVFDDAVGKLHGEDKAVRDRAEADAQQVVKEFPGLLLSRLQAALEGGDIPRATDLERFLAAARSDLSEYQAAKTPQEKLEVLKRWRSGDGPSGNGPSDGTPDE